MSSVVDEIKSRCNIIDVVGRYVQLKRAGSAYKGLCPFHSEKTPSFTVNENDGYYHCHGCGEHGDAFTFLQKIENIDLPNSLKAIYAYSFGDCSFTKIKIPENVEYLDSFAIRECYSLKEIELPERLKGEYHWIETDGIKTPKLVFY